MKLDGFGVLLIVMFTIAIAVAIVDSLDHAANVKTASMPISSVGANNIAPGCFARVDGDWEPISRVVKDGRGKIVRVFYGAIRFNQGSLEADQLGRIDSVIAPPATGDPWTEKAMAFVTGR